MNIIGQSKIIDELNKINSLDYLPKSLLILGEAGSGRHLISDYICNKFNINTEIVDYELSIDVLNEMYNLTVPRMYLIDFSKLSENKHIERFQNTILKFLEEPPVYAWITIISYDSNNLLPTILNRCQKINIKPYSLDELKLISNLYDKSFIDEDLIVLKTPYNIINTSDKILEEIKKLSYNIIDKINVANLSSVLAIRNKLDSDLKINLFVNVFSKYLYQMYINSENEKYFNSLLLTYELRRNLYVLGINKSNLIDNYLVNLKTILDDRFSSIKKSN